MNLRCTGWLDTDAHREAGTRLELLDSKVGKTLVISGDIFVDFVGSKGS